MKTKKKISVKLVGDALEAYNELSKVVGEQQFRGIKSSFEITLWRGIQRALDLIQSNPFYGENAKKKQISNYYIRKYNVDNLFIVDLPNFWRMIYTLQSDEIEIVAFILDIYDHDAYNKVFGFRKK